MATVALQTLGWHIMSDQEERALEGWVYYFSLGNRSHYKRAGEMVSVCGYHLAMPRLDFRRKYEPCKRCMRKLGCCVQQEVHCCVP